MNLQATLNKHKSKEGWLDKKSPRLLVGFQKRYFTIGEDQEQLFLLYDKTLPQRDKKPKGAIMISLIEQIVTKEESKEFILKFGGRDFVLKAANVQQKKEWIESLNFLKEYSISKSGSSDEHSSSGGKTWRFDKLDPNRQRNLRLNQEKKNQGEEEIKKIEVKDEEMQKIKGLYPYFQNYTEEVLSNHIVQGFMYKKKEKFHTKVVQPKYRWFFIFSKYNLTENASNTNDFDLDDLPPFVNPNVLYYYDSRYDDSKIEGEIHVKNIISIKKIDLKVEGDNILKKGIGAVGNQIISAVNKFTEITKLDKIGAHIHQFEFIFQIIAKKGNKEITHNFYSESLLQIEKWVNSLLKIKQNYEEEHQDDKNICTSDSNSPTKSPDVTQTKQDQETTSPELKVSHCSNESDETPNTNGNNNKNQSDEAKLWRSQVIFQQAIKTKERNKLKIGWKDKIAVVKRQIIQIFNDEQDLNNGEQEDYLIIKEIEKITQEKNPIKFRIETKKHEQRSFKLKNEQQCTQWIGAIQKLMLDENTPMDELRQVSTSTTRDTSVSAVTKKVDGKIISINDCKNDCDGDQLTESQPQSKKSSSFKSIDDVLYRGYQATKSNTYQTNRKLTFFQKIFGCCVDPRQEDYESANENEAGRSQLQRKLIS